MKAFKIEKKTKTKTEQIKLVISLFCLMSDIHLSETDILVLTFFIQYKMSLKTDELIISSGVVKDTYTLRNSKMRLCRLGFLKRNKREYKTYELNIQDGYSLDDNDIRFIIKFNNA